MKCDIVRGDILSSEVRGSEAGTVRVRVSVSARKSIVATSTRASVGDWQCVCCLRNYELQPHLVRVVLLWRSAVVVGISLRIGACMHESSQPSTEAQGYS